jgi:hypothetical protein
MADILHVPPPEKPEQMPKREEMHFSQLPFPFLAQVETRVEFQARSSTKLRHPYGNCRLV